VATLFLRGLMTYISATLIYPILERLHKPR